MSGGGVRGLAKAVGRSVALYVSEEAAFEDWVLPSVEEVDEATGVLKQLPCQPDHRRVILPGNSIGKHDSDVVLDAAKDLASDPEVQRFMFERMRRLAQDRYDQAGNYLNPRVDRMFPEFKVDGFRGKEADDEDQLFFEKELPKSFHDKTKDKEPKQESWGKRFASWFKECPLWYSPRESEPSSEGSFSKVMICLAFVILSVVVLKRRGVF
jgi:hypothetical protein